jgi:hypothetical protein
MIIFKRIVALSYVASRTIYAIASLLLCAVFLPNAGTIQALELSGVLSLVDARPDTFRIDFSKLDTPVCEIGFNRDTIDSPDIIFILLRAQSPALFLLRAPFTPSSDSMTINVDRFSGSSFMPAYAVNVDSLRRTFLPIAASVNPECIQSGQCDTAGGGFFVKTSERGVAFVRPYGSYVGGYDRYHFFWAYSSDGTFGGNTEIVRNPAQPRFNTAASLRGNGYAIYDLQGRRSGLADKMAHNQLVIMKNSNTGKVIARIRIEQRSK